MSVPETGRVGERGTVVIPEALRERFGLGEGALVVVEARPDGVLIRPADDLAETYSPERQAAFLLENAVDRDDYLRAREAVLAMGVDPDAVAHEPPVGR